MKSLKDKEYIDVSQFDENNCEVKMFYSTDVKEAVLELNNDYDKLLQQYEDIGYNARDLSIISRTIADIKIYNNRRLGDFTK